ncbi:MAG: U32 family peptidase [Desulfobulbaceae bacterium]|nr:U32 family peptidase [Desulfobulbaceae bacterium]
MKRKIELLAPGGDLDSIKAAIAGGADAIYCGLNNFNARNRAENIPFGDLNGILRLAHKNACEVFLTLNIIIVESEIRALIGLLNKLSNTAIDGVIVQDLGLLYLLATYFPTLNIHGSTQLTTHNDGQIKFLSKLKARRVNLSRELSLQEIKGLARTGHENQVLSEVFVHGSNCISFSGLCFFSSVHGGNSGNRGRCSQPCRNQYLTTEEGKNFPLNLKDNSAYTNLGDLAQAGVDSIKIEGRIKKFHYVYTVVKAFREQLQTLYRQDTLSTDTSELHKVFNRDFTNGFLEGVIDRYMYIDNPMDNSARHRAASYGTPTGANIERAKRELYDLKTEIITRVKKIIGPMDSGKAPLTLAFSGQAGTPLKVTARTPDTSFHVLSGMNLAETTPYSTTSAGGSGNRAPYLNTEMLSQRFKGLNDTAYFIKDIQLTELQGDLFIPFKELTSLKKEIIFSLNGGKETIAPIDVPLLKRDRDVTIKPALSLLISSRKDVHLCNETEAEIYFQLPHSLANGCAACIELFTHNKKLIPWFPAVLIGEDYHAGVKFLKEVQPERIITNNTGIAYEACQQGIPWIAGPYLNIVNSFSLVCLKENFNCSGAFISNEINRQQIKRITKPDNFELYYSIYHPIVLLTSRQCLFHQVSGCQKHAIDAACMSQCERSATITNLKGVSLRIEKTKGNYHRIYNDINFLNTDIVTDLPNLFSRFFIDLRDIKTSTNIESEKPELVKLFADHLAGRVNAAEVLRQHIHPSTASQYEKGI